MLRIATRGSALARWQAERVAALLGGDVELVVVSTSGDQRRDVPIHTMGGTGVFVKEVQDAVLDGHADVAVHSAKDLPAVGADGLLIAAVPERADVRDAMIGATLTRCGSGRRSRPGRCGGARNWPRCVRISSSRSCGATSTRGWRRRSTSTPSCWPARGSTGWAWVIGSRSGSMSP